MKTREELSWFSLMRQPQEPLAPEGVPLDGGALDEWRQRFRPFLNYLRRKEVVVALSGGGMAMACHVSVLRVLELLGVPISRVYGTSAGAVVGGLYSAGMSTAEMEQMMLDIRSPDDLFGFAARLPGLRLMTGAVVRTLTRPSLEQSGIYSRSRIEEYVEGLMNKYLGGVPTMGDLKSDFACLAFDIGTGRPDAGEMATKKIFSRERTPDVRLDDAIGASMSIPGAFTPKKLGDRFYIDGGAVEHLPITTAVEDWLARRRRFGKRQVIIAVDLGYSGAAPLEETVCSPTDLVMYSNTIQSRAITQYSLQRCHHPRKGTSVVLIRPKLFSIRLCEIEKIPAALYTAYENTIEQLSGQRFLERTEDEMERGTRFLGLERTRPRGR